MAKNKANKKIILISAVAVLAVVIGILFMTGTVSQIRLKLSPGGEVSEGVLSGVDPDVHIMNVPEGEIRYLINKRIVFEDKYSLGSVMLENPETCLYDIKFVIYRDNGEMIYTSPMIKPGECLEKDKLTEVLDSGEYNCSYSAQAYLNGELQGEVTGVVTVIVG